MLKKIFTRLKRISHVSLVSLLCTGIVLSVAPSVHAATLKAAPRISFTFDDGMTNAVTLAAPALQKYGYTGTDYVISGCVGMTTAPNTCKADQTHTYMTWAQINSLHTDFAWEIGSHTETHPFLASTDPTDQPNLLTPAEVEAELANSKAAITANTGIVPTAFASPYGDYNPSGTPVLSLVAKYYTSHRGFADIGYNTFPYNDYLLVDQPVQGNISVATVKGYIDQALASNSWLILTFHDIVASGASTAEEDYQYNVADLEAIAAYAKSKGITNTNVTDGLAGSTGNLFTNGTFDAPVTAVTNTAADTTTWTTDNTTVVTQDAAGNGSQPSPTNSVMIASTSSAGMLHMFSPMVAVAPKPYVIKAYVNIKTIGTLGELAFYVDEYDAAGNYVTTQYKKAWSVFNAPNPLVREHAFEYTPTTTLNGASVSVAKARLQLVAVTDTGMQCYIDNLQWFAEDGSGAAKSGDLNNDNVVDGLDLSVVLANWNKTTTTGDLNNDNVVDGLDLSIVLANWGK